MSAQTTNNGGLVLSGWIEVAAYHARLQPGRPNTGGPESFSFQQEIARAQSEVPGEPAVDFGRQEASLSEPCPVPDSGQSGPDVPAVVHHFRPIYFGQPEMPRDESDALGQAAIEALNAALLNAGIDPSRVSMKYMAHYFNSPAGGVPTRMIRVETAGGRWEEFSADWTILKPHITAAEISDRLLGGTTPPLVT